MSMVQSMVQPLGQFRIGCGIGSVPAFRPRFSQIIEYARVADPFGFLSWMESRADDTDLEELLEEYANSEKDRIRDFFALRELWRER